MANLGGKISLDISEFQQKIAEANRLIRANESAWHESAAQMANWSTSEEGLRARVETFNKQINAQQTIIETLTAKRAAMVETYGAESKEVDKVNYEIIKYSKALEETRKRQAAAETALNGLTNEQNENRKSLEKHVVASNNAEKQTKSLATAVSKCGSDFSVLKATVANLTSTAITNLIKSFKQLSNMVNTLPDSTRTLRRQLVQLETAFADVGYSANVARNAYVDYNAVLGAVDSNASSTISLLAALSSSQKDVATWTTTLTGVYAKLGVAIPTNELTKNIQQTANTAKMTENLTKVLQNAGVDVEDITKELESLNTAQERADYLLATLNREYGELGEKYIKNNESIVEAEKAQSRVNIATSKFGAMMEPLKTTVSNAVADILESLSALATGEEGAAEELAYNIGYLMGTVASLWDDVYEQLEPYLGLLKESIKNWFDNNKDELLAKFKDWLTSIFGEDTVNVVQNLTRKIIEPIETLFKKLSAGDYEGALGAALPIITIGVGLSLLKGTAASLPSTITTALSTAFSAKSLTLAGGFAGLVGAVSLGIKLKDAMEAGDYKAWAQKTLQSVLDGLAVFGVTGSLSAGAFAFALSTTLDISAVEFASKAKDALGLPDVVMNVAPVLSTASLVGIRTALSSGLAAGLGAAFKASAIASAVVGVVGIGLQVKDAMSTSDWDTVIANIAAGLIAGVGVGVITGNPKLGMMAFNIAVQLKLGENVVEGLAEQLNTARNNIAEFVESVKTGGLENIEVAVDKAIISPKAVELKADDEALKAVQIEVLKIFNRPAVVNSYKAALEALIRDARKGGAEVAEEFVAGYGIGLEELPEISEAQAKQIIVAVKDALDIHSPSREGIYIGEMFKQGFTEGYEGLPNALKKTTENAINAVTGSVAESESKIAAAWAKIWKGIKKGADVAGDALNGLRDAITSVLESYSKEEGADSVYNALFSKGTDALASAGGWGAFVSAILDVVKTAIESDEDTDVFLEELANDIVEGATKLLENLPAIVKLASKFIKELVKGLIKALPDLLKEIPNIVADIVETFLNMLPKFVQLGWELIQGLSQGIWEGIKSIGNIIYEAGAAVVDWFKDVFGIASPSKVMKREIGRNIALGVVEGINENIPAINSALNNVNTRLEFGAKSITSAGTSNKIVNVVQNNSYSRSYSAYELYKSERAIKQLVGAY